MMNKKKIYEWSILWFVLGCIYPRLVIATKSTIVFEVMPVCIFILYNLYNHKNLKECYSLKAFSKRNFIYAVLIAILIYILIEPAMLLLNLEIVKIINVKVSTDNPLNGNLLYNLFISIIIAPICEEIFFRGTVFRFFKGSIKAPKLGFIIATIISSFAFMIVHYSNVRVIDTFLVGVCFCFIYTYSGSIYVSMIIHAIYNSLTFLHLGSYIISKLEVVFGNAYVLIYYGFGVIGACMIIYILRNMRTRYLITLNNPRGVNENEKA